MVNIQIPLMELPNILAQRGKVKNLLNLQDEREFDEGSGLKYIWEWDITTSNHSIFYITLMINNLNIVSNLMRTLQISPFFQRSLLVATFIPGLKSSATSGTLFSFFELKLSCFATMTHIVANKNLKINLESKSSASNRNILFLVLKLQLV